MAQEQKYVRVLLANGQTATISQCSFRISEGYLYISTDTECLVYAPEFWHSVGHELNDELKA